MKISASLYSNTDRTIENLVKELDQCHIDYFHIDCNDDLSVFDDIREIRKISKTPIDLHIISDKPEQYFDLIDELAIEFVSIQYENLSGHYTFPANGKTSFGLAIVSDTPVEVFEDYKDQCDFVLIMTTTPGQSGGEFRADNFKKIRQFRTKYPEKKIQVDGGVNDVIGFVMRMLGVDSVVSGSYLVKHPSIGMALLHLRSSSVNSDYKVKDFMIELEDSPTILSAQADVKSIISEIENHKQGFVMLTQNGILSGLSSNADVRRGLLKNINNFNSILPQDIINNTPVTINEEATITEMLKLVKSKKFLISFLPVVDKGNTLKGYITFINLIRSES